MMEMHAPENVCLLFEEKIKFLQPKKKPQRSLSLYIQYVFFIWCCSQYLWLAFIKYICSIIKIEYSIYCAYHVISVSVTVLY